MSNDEEGDFLGSVEQLERQTSDQHKKKKKKNKKSKIFNESTEGIALTEESAMIDKRIDIWAQGEREQMRKILLDECKQEFHRRLEEMDTFKKDKEELTERNWELQTKNEMLEKLLEARTVDNVNLTRKVERYKEFLKKVLNEIQIKDQLISELKTKLKQPEVYDMLDTNKNELEKAREEIKNKDKIIETLNSKLRNFNIREQESAKCTKNQGIRFAAVSDLAKRISKVTDDIKNVSGTFKKWENYIKGSNESNSSNNNIGRVKRNYHYNRERYVWVNPNIRTELNLKVNQDQYRTNLKVNHNQDRTNFKVNPNQYRTNSKFNQNQDRTTLRVKQNGDIRKVDKRVNSRRNNNSRGRPLKDEAKISLDAIKDLTADISEKVLSPGKNNAENNKNQKEGCEISLEGLVPIADQERTIRGESLKTKQSEDNCNNGRRNLRTTEEPPSFEEWWKDLIITPITE